MTRRATPSRTSRTSRQWDEVNAETITDEQIRELRDSILAASPRFVDDDAAIRHACWALGESRWCGGVDCRIPHGYEGVYRRAARVRCAAAWNARHGGGP